MGQRRRKRSIWRHRDGRLKAPAYVAIVATALIAATTVTGAAIAMSVRPEVPAAVSNYTPKPMPTPTPIVQTQPADVMSRLDDPSRPFVISVLGDSTGAIGRSWVYQLADWVSETYDRPVEFHQWAVELEPDQYQPTQYIGDGENAPIIIWNGSASGKPVAYSRESWQQLVPIDPATVDLAFINHGHNQGPDTLTRDASGLLDQMHDAMPNSSIVVIGQNPQGPNGPMGANQKPNVQSWMSYAQRNGYAIVDVLDVFEQQGDYIGLLDSVGVHPTVEGSRLWRDAVIATLTAQG